jgi:predicted DNA-binding transcriptional regulator YafY
MRASRLLSVLLTLQTRERVTAQELADELEVSVRTVYRDIESLSAAGVPVYAERGPAGGYRLLEGFRTRVNGLTGDEAESLFLAALPGQAAELGLGAVVASARLKVLAGLPPQLRERAGVVRQRFHLDAPGWYRDGDQAPFLAAVAGAVWNDRRIRMRYRRWSGEVERELDPYGLVLKGGAWYLVARTTHPTDHPHRTYRITRILDLHVLDASFPRDPGFDLGSYWKTWTEQFEERQFPVRALVRISPAARLLVRHLFSSTAGRILEETARPPLPR